MSRPFFDCALAALQAAHDACMNAPDRDVLGMSHGPFSGVNEALGIVARLESANALLQGQMIGLLNDRPALLARVAELEAVLARMAQGWDNAIELGLIPLQHVETAETLRDAARAASAPMTKLCTDISDHGSGS